MARVHQVTPHAQHKQTHVYVYGRRCVSSHASGAPRGRGACSEWSKPGKVKHVLAHSQASPGTGHRSALACGAASSVCGADSTPPDLRRAVGPQTRYVTWTRVQVSSLGRLTERRTTRSMRGHRVIPPRGAPSCFLTRCTRNLKRSHARGRVTLWAGTDLRA